MGRSWRSPGPWRRTAPFLIAHRGDWTHQPQNTLASFRAAFSGGADGVECDLQKTADGRYVIIHDPSVHGPAGAHLAIGGMSFEELRSIDLGGGERIPGLEELPPAIPNGALLDLELKAETLTARDCPRVLEILDSAIPRKALMISSFEPDLLLPFRGTGVTVGLLIGTRTAALGPWRLLSVLLRLRPSFLNVPVEAFAVLGRHKARLAFWILRALGSLLLFWTVNTEGQIQWVCGLARAVATDDLAAARKALDRCHRARDVIS